jgi:hypothetical protein
MTKVKTPVSRISRIENRRTATLGGYPRTGVADFATAPRQAVILSRSNGQ